MKVVNSSVIYENPLPQLKSVISGFPYLCKISDGTILASHAMGEAFESVDMTNHISKSFDMGKTWEKPYKMFHEDNGGIQISDCCKISKIGDQKLIALGYSFERSNPELPLGNPKTGGLLDDEVFYSISDDNGETWSKRKAINTIWGPHVEASAPITVLQDGSWASPITCFGDWDGNIHGEVCGRLLRSYDNGNTWSDDVKCMDFGSDDITCFEQRICQLDNGTIVTIGWNENTKTGELYNNHYTVSTDNGKTFSKPADTGIHGQASSVCAIGGNKLLATCALRRDVANPGVYGYIVEISDSGEWNIIDEAMLWQPSLPIKADGNMAQIFAFLKFGQPSAIMLDSNNALMCHWICEDGIYKTVCTHIEL